MRHRPIYQYRSQYYKNATPQHPSPNNTPPFTQTGTLLPLPLPLPNQYSPIHLPQILGQYLS